MNAIILLTTPNPVQMDESMGYEIGAAIALFILIYLLYALIKPEKF